MCDPYLLSSLLPIPRREQRWSDDDRPRGRRAARGARELGLRPGRLRPVLSYKIGGTRRFDRDEVRGWIVDHREAEPRSKRREAKPKTKRTRANATRRAGDPQPRLFE